MRSSESNDKSISRRRAPTITIDTTAVRPIANLHRSSAQILGNRELGLEENLFELKRRALVTAPEESQPIELDLRSIRRELYHLWKSTRPDDYEKRRKWEELYIEVKQYHRRVAESTRFLDVATTWARDMIEAPDCQNYFDSQQHTTVIEASKSSQQLQPQIDLKLVCIWPYTRHVIIEEPIELRYQKLQSLQWNQVPIAQKYLKLWNRVMAKAHKSHGSSKTQEWTCTSSKNWDRVEESPLQWYIKRRHSKSYLKKREGTITVSKTSKHVEEGRSHTENFYGAATPYQFHKNLSFDMQGRRILQIWKCSAGRYKSWRRYPRPTTQMCAQQLWTEQKRRRIGHMLSISLIWLPSAMLRSRQRETCSRIRRLEHCETMVKSARHNKTLHIDDFCEAIEEVISNDSNRKTILMQGETNDLHYELNEEYDELPGKAFIRFAWKEKILVNGLGQLDRFLPTDLLLRSGWRISEFIRNDHHADVYSLSKDNTRVCKSEMECLEAHIFLDEYHGNSKVFANRQKNSIRRSGHCLDSFWHCDRHVFIKRTFKEVESFRLRNNEKEFPSLVSQKTCMKHVALQRRCFSGRPSFAAVANNNRPRIEISTSSTAIHEPALGKVYRPRKEASQSDRHFFQIWKEQCHLDLELVRRETRMAGAEHCQFDWESSQRECEK
jgi:hypothetical protein